MASPSLSALTNFDRKLVVGVGGLAVSSNQSVILTTYSLGSCVGVTIYDPVAHAGGLLHAMLPDSSINSLKATEQPAMFVDTGLAALFMAASKLAVERRRVQICVAGGAQFLDDAGLFNIGQRNYAKFSELMRREGMMIHAEAVGGLTSRTMHLSLRTGEVRLKVSGQRDEITLFPGKL
jgi:chemotaxis protein CheD